MGIRTLDLFCGGGGSSWGARSAGAEIVGGVDRWELATLTYQDNFPDARPVNKLLHARSNRQLLGEIGSIDLILASPECTNHTCARGSRARDEESLGSSRYVLNFVRALQPRWVVIENVVQLRRWSGYSDLVRELERDYFVKPQVLDASAFGVPQQRRRLFVLCDRFTPPPDLTGKTLATVRNASGILDTPGTWPRRPLFTTKRAKPTLERANRAMAALGMGVPFLIVYYGTDGAGGWQSLDRPLRTLTTLDRFGLVEWDSGLPTLRMLQVPELKRAMGFSDSYRLERGSRRERIKLLGNAVSPPVMSAIIHALTGNNRPTTDMVLSSRQPALHPLLSLECGDGL